MTDVATTGDNNLRKLYHGNPDGSFSESVYIDPLDDIGTPNVTTVSVGISSTAIIAANPNRRALILSNTGANSIFVNLSGAAAVVTNTEILPHNGIVIDRYCPVNAITGIAATAATNLSVTEINQV